MASSSGLRISGGGARFLLLTAGSLRHHYCGLFSGRRIDDLRNIAQDRQRQLVATGFQWGDDRRDLPFPREFGAGDCCSACSHDGSAAGRGNPIFTTIFFIQEEDWHCRNRTQENQKGWRRGSHR